MQRDCRAARHASPADLAVADVRDSRRADLRPLCCPQMEARHGIDRPELEDPRVMSVLMSKLGWKMEMYEFQKK